MGQIPAVTTIFGLFTSGNYFNLNPHPLIFIILVAFGELWEESVYVINMLSSCTFCHLEAFQSFSKRVSWITY